MSEFIDNQNKNGPIVMVQVENIFEVIFRSIFQQFFYHRRDIYHIVGLLDLP